MKYLVTFSSTAFAIKAENVFLNHNIAIKIRPLPNEISSGCGISIVFDDLEKVRKIIESEKIKYNKLYHQDGMLYNVID